ncbi:MAG: acetylaminoadipate kinase [Candidatus Hecatellales archaeon]|nr:MAG: acetylaminoadipate kinase [Candidatus Hecatellales archaeon]
MEAFQGRLVVVKVGGRLVQEGGVPEGILQDLKALHEQAKASLVFIHGGADIVTDIAKRMGKEQKFIVSPDGMRSRYTDKETMEIYTMVMAGKVNKSLVASFQSKGIKAVGLSGADGMLLKAERKKKLVILDERGRKIAIDGGYTGKIREVNVELLKGLLSAGYLPVVAPIAIDDEFNLLNVDSDRAAAYIAGALKADHLVYCTDVEGLILDGKLVRKLTLFEAEEELPRIGHGMKRKVYAAVEALNMGVKEAVITYGLGESPVIQALQHKVGTLLVP